MSVGGREFHSWKHSLLILVIIHGAYSALLVYRVLRGCSAPTLAKWVSWAAESGLLALTTCSVLAWQQMKQYVSAITIGLPHLKRCTDSQTVHMFTLVGRALALMLPACRCSHQLASPRSLLPALGS